MVSDGKIYFAKTGENGDSLNEKIYLDPRMANRHGFICGATGTGKTVTLKVLAESFSALGVPVFLADVKGDLSGMSQPGQDSEDMQKRAERFGLAQDGFSFQGFPTQYFDIYGKRGIPLRTTVSEIGPQLMAGILGLNDTQSDILSVVYKLADDEDLLLCDTKDLKAILQFASENAAELETEYGHIAKQSVAAIVRAIVALEGEGADQFFSEPAINVADFFTTDPSGKGTINVLDSSSLINKPRLYSAFMLYLLSELFEVLPEVGDLDKPRVVFFFDEAHLLFSSASRELMEKIEQMIKLIRSKGVGVFFITQSPGDIPDEIASQLGNKIEHGLRAYTPAERKVLKAAAESFRENPAFDTMELLSQLGTGEAVVSLLDEKGVPGMAQHAWVLPPRAIWACWTTPSAIRPSRRPTCISSTTPPPTRIPLLSSWSAASSSRRRSRRRRRRRSRLRKPALPPRRRPPESRKRRRSASAGPWSAASKAWRPPRQARWAGSWATCWAGGSARSAKSWAATWAPASAATCWARCSSADRGRRNAAVPFPL